MPRCKQLVNVWPDFLFIRINTPRHFESFTARLRLSLNMNSRFLLPVLASVAVFSTAGLSAQPNLQQVLKDTAVAAHWIYDDYTQAVARATASGKPLLVTLRCVP
jgi:hypothetical protein